MLKRPGPDDWCIVAAACCSIIYVALTITQSRYGLGLPLLDRPKANLNTYAAVNFAGRPFYMLGILMFKIALCLGYLRILSPGQRTYRFVVWGVLSFTVAAHLAFTLVLLFNCKPVKKSWRPLTVGTCLPNAPVNFSLSGFTITSDVIIFLLPIPFMYQLQMPNRKKFAVMGVFMLGLFTTICSGLRMTQTRVVAFGNGNSTMLVLWGNVEMNVGIILTCVPVLAPLFAFFSQRSSTKGYQSNGADGHSMDVLKTDLNSRSAGSKAQKYTGHNSHVAGSNESQETILTSSDTPTAVNGRLQNGEILKTIQIDVKRTEKDEQTSHDRKTFFDSE